MASEGPDGESSIYSISAGGTAIIDTKAFQRKKLGIGVY